MKDKERKMLPNIYRKKACNITKTCESLNISRRNFYLWRKKFKRLDEELKSIEEELLDRAEEKLQELINSGHFEAIRYFLSCKGKRRGYTKHEIDTGVANITVISHVPRPRIAAEK